MEEDVEDWYWQEVEKIKNHAAQVENELYNHMERLRKPYNPEIGYNRPSVGSIRKTEKCLNHATALADYTERISARNPMSTQGRSYLSWFGIGLAAVGLLLIVIGLFIMGLTSFWVGVGLSITGLVLLVIGALVLFESQRLVLAFITGGSCCILLILFIILAVVLV